MDVFKLKRFTDEGLLSDDIRAEQLISPLAVDESTGFFSVMTKRWVLPSSVSRSPAAEKRSRKSSISFSARTFRRT